jgi:hypothetical protein
VTATGGTAGGPLRRLAAVVVAAALTAGGWLIGRSAGVDYVVETAFGAREVTLVATVSATIVAALVGWLVVVLLERFTTTARRIWLALGTSVLVASVVPVFAAPGNTGSQVTLTVLHCVAALVLVPGLYPRRTS